MSVAGRATLAQGSRAKWRRMGSRPWWTAVVDEEMVEVKSEGETAETRCVDQVFM